MNEIKKNREEYKQHVSNKISQKSILNQKLDKNQVTKVN